MRPARVVLTTAPNARTARRLARTLVGERLCACVSIVPGVWSIYQWAGKVQEARELLLVVKTTRAKLPSLKRRLVALHPYEVPELLALQVADGLAPYLEWVASVTA